MQPIVLVAVKVQDRFIVGVRSKTKKQYAGFCEFPGGKVEDGEDAEDAARREFREETGILLHGLKPLFTGVVDGFHVNAFLAEMDRLPCRLEPGVEHSSLELVSAKMLGVMRWCPVDLAVVKCLE